MFLAFHPEVTHFKQEYLKLFLANYPINHIGAHVALRDRDKKQMKNSNIFKKNKKKHCKIRVLNAQTHPSMAP